MNRTIEGIIPPYLMLELIRRNPEELWHGENLALTQKLCAKDVRKSRDKKNSGKRKPRTPGAASCNVYDAQHTTRLPGTKARFEPETAVSDKTVNTVYDNTVNTRRWHKEVLGWNGMDNAGMEYNNTCHYGVNYNNAYAQPASGNMVYGDGDQTIFKEFTLLDIDLHEKRHIITAHTCNLEYSRQSGALNEHLSDVDGLVGRQFIFNLTADQDSWLIGPGIFMPGINGRALRDARNPGTAYNDSRLGKDPQPDHMSRFVETLADNGGVHINSGILNKAFALWAIAVGGYAWKTTYQVWWQASKEISSDCDFQTFANKTVEVAKRMLGNEVQKLVDAWAVVGITVA